ncbi:MAG: FAD-dependent oxidoreductase [Reyranella sp.]|nr:FAD-dependent oxidoreductase [Reyranella sp.]
MAGASEVMDADVIVVGSGAAGLSAALAAAHDGAKVVVLEKSRWLGGTSAMSGAGTWVPCNHHMMAAGIADSPEETLEYIRGAAPPGWQKDEDELWQVLAEQSAPMLRFLEDETPLRFELVNHPDLYAEVPGGRKFGRMVSTLPISRFLLGRLWNRVRPSVKTQLFTYRELVDGVLKNPVRGVLGMAPTLLWRLLTASVGAGNALIVGLARGCLDKGCVIQLETPVTRLLMENDAVVGVEAMIDGEKRSLRAARGVVLATGGFDWNAELMTKHFPGLDLTGAPDTNTGDGQVMAAEAGAELAHMDQALISPATFTTYEGRRHAQPLLETYAPHVILVNRHAKRFVSEGSPALGVAVDERGPDGKPAHLPAWRIFDSRYAKAMTLSMHFGSKEKGFIRRADTIEALAKEIDLDPQALRATVDRFNGWSKEGVDRDFHRGETVWERFYTKDRALGTVEQGPFYAAPFLYVSLGTKGGPRTNRHGQVLRPDRSVIGGLYCAGLAASSPIGTKAVGAGTTIGPFLTFGYVAGKAIARRNV